MQAGPAKANELFTKLAETSDGALKTRDRLFVELKAELETHTDLEEQHLFPVLRKHAETRELVTAALRDNKDLRAKLAELEVLPKNDVAFLGKLSELRKAFRQHARDETKELLPAVQTALSEQQVQGITEKMETSVAEAEQAKHDQDEERRATARRERQQAQEKEAMKREQQERDEVQARQQATAEREQQVVARRAREVAQQTAQAVVQTAEAASESTRQLARSVEESAQRVAAASATAPLSTGTMFWDMWLGMTGLQPSRSTSNRGADAPDADTGARNTSNKEEVIQLAEEFVTVEKRKVNTGTTRVHRYVVETPVEQEVTLVREKVVVERRRPLTDKVNGEALTELTVEVFETDEVPVVGKGVRLKEEVVVRTERTEHVETVHETVRQDQVEIKHSNKRPARVHPAT